MKYIGLGFNQEILVRLWRLITSMSEGCTRDKLPEHLGISMRAVTCDINRLRSIGFPLQYRRTTRTYTVGWPTTESTIRLEPTELFYCFYILSLLEKKSTHLSELKARMFMSKSPESSPIHDCGPAYGISQNINGIGADLLEVLSVAIQSRHKIAFLYEKPNGETDLREVYPYKLFHTPISWFLAGWDQDSKDFRTFKLARMSFPKTLKESFVRQPFDIQEFLGDAWWVQHDKSRLSNPYEIKVLFKGEAGKAIREYHFHKTQIIESHPEGSLVTWHLSYLYEFASWLMQWLGQIEIVSCDELKEIIKGKIKATVL